jgi:diacylglycerol kinase (ATP)
VETCIDRIGPEWHALSKRAKDMGSAAVLLSLVLCAGVWSAALYQRFAA